MLRALQAHAGFRDEARRLARLNINAMLDDRSTRLLPTPPVRLYHEGYGDLLANDAAIRQSKILRLQGTRCTNTWSARTEAADHK